MGKPKDQKGNKNKDIYLKLLAPTVTANKHSPHLSQINIKLYTKGLCTSVAVTQFSTINYKACQKGRKKNSLKRQSKKDETEILKLSIRNLK